MIYWNPLFKVSISDTSIEFSSESGRFALNRPPTLNDWGVLSALHRGVSSTEVAAASKIEKTLLIMLAKKKLIAELPVHPEFLTTDRNAGHFLTFDSNPAAALQRIRSAEVCLLGVGGVGSVVLQHLVALGIRKFLIVDKDSVEVSNLNRQFIFTPSDVGKLKVNIASAFIRSRAVNAEIETRTAFIDSEKSLEKVPIEKCQIVINCLDTPRNEIDSIVYKCGLIREVAVITAGVGVYYGHWGPLICPGGAGITYEDWKQSCLKSTDGPPINESDTPTPWSFGPTNTLIASSLARDVIEWLGGRASVGSLNTRKVQRFSDNLIISYSTNSPRQEDYV
jgi:molybdopterin/thiamine biosynthesis adenylyltransferase